MTARLVTVFGGNGFVGRHVVQRLAKAGARVRVACRDPEAAIFLKPLGNPGQIIPVKANITDKDEVARAVEGADAVVNCVGIIASVGWNTFSTVHKFGAANIAKATQMAGIETLVHVSALGADRNAPSQYAQSKAAGELATLNAFPNATIIRPAMIIGAEDNSLNLFANLARFSPVIPMINPLLPSLKMVRGNLYSFLIPTFEPRPREGSRFQPVVVSDVADAIMCALNTPATQGEIYEVAGPTAYSFKALMDLMMKNSGRKRCVMSLPAMWAYFWAFFAEFIPGKPFTRDMVTLLNHDNLPTGDHKNLGDLGLKAHSLESTLPTYMRTYGPPSSRRVRLV